MIHNKKKTNNSVVDVIVGIIIVDVDIAANSTRMRLL